MDNSIFIARIFGLCYLIVGTGIMFNRKAFQQLMDDFCKNVTSVFFGGLLALVVGLAIILTHNVWVANWTVIITIIGWLALIKGMGMIVFPNTVSKFMQVYQKNKGLLMVHSIGAFVFGVVLTFLGFFAE